jgi:polar amino acid transport system permease protein
MTWAERWALIERWAPQLWEGTLLTLELVTLAVVLGLILALPLGLARASRHWYWRVIPYGYIFFFRGTPLLLQLFLVYYGLSQFEVVRNSVLWSYLREPYWCALITMILHTAAYTAEIVRGAIAAIPPGEIEAAQALGMTWRQTLQHILLPRALRIGFPAYGNEIILMLKASAVVYTVTLMDVMGVIRTINARTYQYEMFFFIAGLIYLTITLFFTQVFSRIERHLRITPHE